MLFFSFFLKKETRRNKNRGPLFGCYLVFVIFDGRVNIETFTDFSFQFPEGLPQFRNIIPQIGEVTRLGNLAEKIGEFTMMMIPFCLVVRGGGVYRRVFCPTFLDKKFIPGTAQVHWIKSKTVQNRSAIDMLFPVCCLEFQKANRETQTGANDSLRVPYITFWEAAMKDTANKMSGTSCSGLAFPPYSEMM